MKKMFLAAALAGLAAAPLHAASPAAPEDAFTSFWAFGDSLTDDGKLDGALIPPSFEGRFTNGLTWADIIAAGFAVSGNYALGGATAGPENENVYPAAAAPLATLAGQGAAFAATGAAFAGSNPLVAVWAGSNDIFQNWDEAGFDPAAAADALADMVLGIAALGPEFDHFLIPMLPGATGSPAFPDGVSPLAPFTAAFNLRLAERIAAMELSGLTVITPDIAAASAAIVADPAAYGITNLTEPCTVTMFALVPPNCTHIGEDPDTGAPIFDLSLADSYYFVDGVHPSAPVHAAWAGAATGAIMAEVYATPLPAGGALLLAGLGALALRRRG